MPTTSAMNPVDESWSQTGIGVLERLRLVGAEVGFGPALA
jgi:hypothetical protein